MMAIPPNDEVDNLNTTKDLVDNQVIEEKPVQVAMANNVGRKVSKSVIDGAKKLIDDYTETEGKKAGQIRQPDILEGEALKKQKQKQLEDAQKKEENIKKMQEGGIESPLINVEESGKVYIRPATQDELKKLEIYSKDVSLQDTFKTSQRLKNNKTKYSSDKGDVVVPNLKNVKTGGSKDADASLREIITATYMHYKDITTASGQRLIRIGERGFSDIIKDANMIGSADALLMLLQRTPGERPFTDAEFLAARRTVVALQLEAERLIKKARKTGSAIDKAKAAQAISLEGYASIMLFSAQEDAARGLASMRIIASPSKARISAINQVFEQSGVMLGSGNISQNNLIDYLEAYGGEEAIDKLLYFYERAPNDRTRHEFAKRSVMRRYLLDPMAEIYQSALLSNPITHSFNIVGQFAMLQLQPFEKLLEGKPKEAYAMFMGQFKYMMQAFRAGKHALIHERTITDGATKLDMDMKAISSEAFGIDRDASTFNNVTGMAIDGFGAMMRMQGYRPLVAMDEVFKVMARGMKIEELATTAKINSLKQSKAAGIPDDKAQTLATAAYVKALHSNSTFDEAVQFGKYVTFQDDLPAFFRDFQGFINHPIMKIWMPFYKTPTNIFLRITERTPFGIAMPKNFKAVFMGGSGDEKRAVMSKIISGQLIGTGLMAVGSGIFGDSIAITGYGPRTKKERANWLETHEPYSIGVKQEDGGYKWISYARYEPISGLIAFAVDTKDVLYNIDDPKIHDDLVLNLGLATTNYVSETLPMIQLVGELMELQGTPYADSDSKFERVQQILAKQAVSAGVIIKDQVTSVGMYGQGMKGLFERTGEPVEGTGGGTNPSLTKPSNIKEIYPNVPGLNKLDNLIIGGYEALEKACARTPGCSDTQPVNTNRWGEVVPQSTGTFWSYWSPFKVIKKPAANVVNKELAFLQSGLTRLSDQIDPGIKLDSFAFADYKQYYNDPASSEYAKKLFGQDVVGAVKPPPPILETFAELFQSDQYLYEPNPQGGFITDMEGNKVPSSRGHKIREIKKVDALYKIYAKKLTYVKHPQYGALKDEFDLHQKLTGEKPNNPIPPTNNSVMQKIELMKRNQGVNLNQSDIERALGSGE